MLKLGVNITYSQAGLEAAYGRSLKTASSSASFCPSSGFPFASSLSRRGERRIRAWDLCGEGEQRQGKTSADCYSCSTTFRNLANTKAAHATIRRLAINACTPLRRPISLSGFSETFLLFSVSDCSDP